VTLMYNVAFGYGFREIVLVRRFLPAIRRHGITKGNIVRHSR